MVERLLLCLLIFIFWNCSTVPAHYRETASYSSLTLEEILKQIEEHRVIFVGEVHDDPASHSIQLEVLKYLHLKGENISIAIEIFPSSKQDALDKWIKGTIGRNDFEGVFNSVVNIRYDLYEDIFDFARTVGIPIIGIDADRTFIANASKNGVETVSEDHLREIMFSDCFANPDYVERLGFYRNRVYHQSGMPFLCDGQRLRDTIMAYNIAEILKDKEVTVVVLVGIMHASKIAVPEILQKYTEVPYKVILPDAIRHVINREPDSNIADYVWY